MLELLAFLLLVVLFWPLWVMGIAIVVPAIAGIAGLIFGAAISQSLLVGLFIGGACAYGVHRSINC